MDLDEMDCVTEALAAEDVDAALLVIAEAGAHVPKAMFYESYLRELVRALWSRREARSEVGYAVEAGSLRKQLEQQREDFDKRLKELEAEASHLRGVWWDCSELHSRAKALVESPGYEVAERDLAEIVAEWPAPEDGAVGPVHARLVAADRLAEAAQAYLNHSASSDTVNLELEGGLMAALAVYRDNEGSNNE